MVMIKLAAQRAFIARLTAGRPLGLSARADTIARADNDQRD